MEENDNLGENSENFQFLCLRCQQKFKTYCGILQHMQFYKKIMQLIKGRWLEQQSGQKLINEISRADRQCI